MIPIPQDPMNTPLMIPMIPPLDIKDELNWIPRMENPDEWRDENPDPPLKRDKKSRFWRSSPRMDSPMDENFFIIHE